LFAGSGWDTAVFLVFQSAPLAFPRAYLPYRSVSCTPSISSTARQAGKNELANVPRAPRAMPGARNAGRVSTSGAWHHSPSSVARTACSSASDRYGLCSRR
jgi:hypothetical protein